MLTDVQALESVRHAPKGGLQAHCGLEAKRCHGLPSAWPALVSVTLELRLPSLIGTRTKRLGGASGADEVGAFAPKISAMRLTWRTPGDIA